MYEVFNRLSPPYASVCYLECTWANGHTIRASAVVVGVNDVLTALHAVWDNELGWARDIVLIPGADTAPVELRPFGQFSEVMSISARAPTWDTDDNGSLTQAESQNDLALLGLSRPIGQITGWLQPYTGFSSFQGTMAGYPAAGTGLMAEIVFAEASPAYGVYNIRSGLGAGASGGPLLTTQGGLTQVAGVLSGGLPDNSHSTYAGLFGAGTADWLQQAMAGNDGLLAGPGVTVLGGSSNDWIAGTAGADRFTGSGGDDLIEGGAGTDTAVFRGAHHEYLLLRDHAGVHTVQHLGAGPDGVDTLRSIERLQFSDLSIAYDVDGPAGQAYRLYQAAFDRTPDLPGLGYQMRALDQGLPLWLVASHFVESPEFTRTYGNLDDAAFVTQLYANVLDRAPDPGGFAYHTGNLASGSHTRGDVLLGFSESPENQANLIGTISAGMPYII